MGGSGCGKSKQKKGASKKSKCRKPVDREHDQEASTSNYPISIRDKRKNSTEMEESCCSSDQYLKFWERKTEAEVENKLYDEIEMIYSQVLQKLVALGYHDEAAEKAIVMNGHAFGDSGVFSNILINSFCFLTSGCVTDEFSLQKEFNFVSDRVDDLLELLVGLAQEARPDWDRFDAIRNLLALNSQGGIASSVTLQSLFCEFNKDTALHTSTTSCRGNLEEGSCSNLQNSHTPADSVSGSSMLPKRFGLSPEMESVLKENAKMIAALYRFDDHHLDHHAHLQSPHSLLNQNVEEWLEKSGQDPRDAVILDIAQEYQALQKQVAERKAWACSKALQAKERLCQHASELRMLRIEKALENERANRISAEEIKNESMIKEMESAVLSALTRLEHATAAARRLETENSNMRAELEAQLLSASLAEMDLQQVGKRGKKSKKRGAVIEREMEQLRRNIEDHKQEELQKKQELDQLDAKQTEAKEALMEQQQEKESAIALVAREEQMLKEAEGQSRKRQSWLHEQMKRNSESMREDILRLQRELAELKNASWIQNFEMAMAVPLESEEDYGHRGCMVCSRSEASVLFLPCAHQVVCSRCNKLVGDVCPSCQTKIQDKVAIYVGGAGAGTSSA